MLRIGAKLGPYEIQALVGAGGMGEVGFISSPQKLVTSYEPLGKRL